MVSTLAASSTSSSSSNSSNNNSNNKQDTIDQQLYYAQLLAKQQTEAENNEENEKLIDEKIKEESERERKEREWSERNTNLIVNYVPQNMSQEEVRALFGSMGEVEACKLIRDKTTGQSLGYAFVNYERPEDAHKALISMNGLRIQNKTLKVSLARPSKDDIKGANVYVSGLPKSLTQPELEAVFRPFGAIITSRILYDNVTGLSKGVGFVRFDRKTEAETAIEKMSGTSPWGGDETISVKFANSPTSNNLKTSPNNSAVAATLLPLFQQNSLPFNGNPTAAQLNLTPSLLSTAALTAAATSSAGGGPIPGHIPQHRFRFSPLAGAPLISASAPAIPPGNSSLNNVTVPSLNSIHHPLLNNVIPTAALLQQTATNTQQDYLNLLQQQLIQQQLAAYAAATTGQQQNFNAAQQQLAAVAAAQQQQYAMYAALGLPQAAHQNGLTLATSNTVNSTSITTSSTINNHQNNNLTSSPSDSLSNSWTININNLSPETEDSFLWKLFGPFGAVLKAKMLPNKGKGVGIVLMSNYDEAMAAINNLNGLMLSGRQLKVSLGNNTSSMY